MGLTSSRGDDRSLASNRASPLAVTGRQDETGGTVSRRRVVLLTRPYETAKSTESLSYGHVAALSLFVFVEL